MTYYYCMLILFVYCVLVLVWTLEVLGLNSGHEITRQVLYSLIRFVF